MFFSAVSGFSELPVPALALPLPPPAVASAVTLRPFFFGDDLKLFVDYVTNI